MSYSFPCIRHGEAWTADPRLLEAVAAAIENGLEAPEGRIESLLDYKDQLWATWRDDDARQAGAAILSRAWDGLGGRGALHLVRTDDDYDYQEDCMNDASAT